MSGLVPSNNNYFFARFSELAGAAGGPAWTFSRGRKEAAGERASPSVHGLDQLPFESLLLMSQ